MQAKKPRFANGLFCADFWPCPLRFIHNPQERNNMIEKQFGVDFGPPLRRGEKVACITGLQIEIDRLGGVPYGWMRIYETLLFGFYNPRSGHCFPSHKAIALKARCGVRTVQRALKWAREQGFLTWAHGIVRDGGRVLRTSNRYAFSVFLTVRRILAPIVSSNRQSSRGVPTSYRTLSDVAREARTFSFPPAPCTFQKP
jgi:hypothetical protein